MKSYPPFQYLNECFLYFPMTGEAFWKERPLHHFGDARACKVFNSKYAGKPVGSKQYQSIGGAPQCLSVGLRYKNKLHRLTMHKVAWILMTGSEPSDTIDHEDTDPFNNKWSNLRLATQSQQLMNTSMRSDNTSGYKGVTWHKRLGKYTTRIMVDGKRIHLGCYTSAYEAHKAIESARQKYHGHFARTA